MKKISSICIVGGGSSGWITAAILLNNIPDISVTLVESDTVPTIGVGESTLGSFKDLVNNLRLEDKDWMSFCNATHKLSIDFTGWDKKGGTRVKSTISSGDPQPLGRTSREEWFARRAATGIKDKQYHLIDSGWGALLDSGKLCDTDPCLEGWDLKTQGGYHLDAALFGEYLRDKYCKPRGLNHFIGTIKTISRDKGGISKVTTSNGLEITADLFIDCTGFHRVLMPELEVQTSASLINNYAWATKLPYKDKDIELEHSTNATTLRNGWVWNIPLWDRIGTGYVYSDKFITKDEALNEFKEYLIVDRDIPRSKEEVEGLSYFHVSTTPSYLREPWIGNVCAVGLSAGFVEPLGSTGLHLTIRGAQGLIRALQTRDGLVGGVERNVYNVISEANWRGTEEFIAAHFALSERSDSPYWELQTEGNLAPRQLLNSKLRDFYLGSAPFNREDLILLANYGYNIYTESGLGPHICEELLDTQEEYDRSLDKILSEQSSRLKGMKTHFKYLETFIYNG